MNDRYLQAPLVEQPAGNATATCVVDPTPFHAEKDICADCDCLVPPGALVFREEEPKQQPMTGVMSKKMRRAGFACKVISNFGTPHGRDKIDKPLRFLGVAIDGVCDTRMAKINPDVSGRFEISMSGTVSVMLTNDCLKDANVNDLVVISDKAARPHRYHRVPADFQIPVLKKADDYDDPEDAARRIVTKQMKDDGLQAYIGDWRDVLYDPTYDEKLEAEEVSDEIRNDLKEYRMNAPRPLPGSSLWLEDITRKTNGTEVERDSNPVPSWEKLAADTGFAAKFIENAKDHPADKARRMALGVYSDGPTHGSGSKVFDKPATKREGHSKAIGKLLEKGDGYARIRLLPQTEVSAKAGTPEE